MTRHWSNSQKKKRGILCLNLLSELFSSIDILHEMLMVKVSDQSFRRLSWFKGMPEHVRKNHGKIKK